ncbi:MAG: hypothetical protein E7601_00990 [Ruminococcaceae bacterium]|nr:hypothetical protein [Oscillospiraceae bacterium]
MNSTERVRRTIQGLDTDRQPIYGWVYANLTEEINERFGSVAAFEDKYEFDAAHIFPGFGCFNKSIISAIAEKNGEITPDMLLDADIYNSPDDDRKFAGIRASLAHHKKRGRWCYIQTPGFFENFNSIFGIQNHLMWLILYPDELYELYRRQVEWTKLYADKCIGLGADMIHISDDWGSQKDLLFSPDVWKELIFPHVKSVVDHVHSKGIMCSLHSDGNVLKVADGIADIGFDMVHPWQENAGMPYDVYLKKYADRFAILGGVCVQSAIGILPRKQLEAEIRRVFSVLKGKRWIVCTSHFVQNHCSMDDLEFAYDLIYKLARE